MLEDELLFLLIVLLIWLCLVIMRGKKSSRPRTRPYKSERFVTGDSMYVSDVRLPNMLHAALLRSMHAHARSDSAKLKILERNPARLYELPL